MVLPEPVGATRTRQLPCRKAWRIDPWYCQIGSEVCTDARRRDKRQRARSNTAKTASDNPSMRPDGMNLRPLAKRTPKTTRSSPTRMSAM